MRIAETAVGAAADRPAVGRVAVAAGARRARGADDAILGVLDLTDPFAGRLAAGVVSREVVPAAWPRPVQPCTGEPVLRAPGQPGREAGREGVALLDDRAVGVAASPPAEQRRVLPERRHARLVDPVVGVGEEVLPVPGREVEAGGARRIEAVDVVQLHRVEALGSAHGDPVVDHRLEGVQLPHVQPALLREAEVDLAQRVHREGAAAEDRAGVQQVVLPSQVGAARPPSDEPAWLPATWCAVLGFRPWWSESRRCRRSRQPAPRCARAVPRARFASPSASAGRCDRGGADTSSGGRAAACRRPAAAAERPRVTVVPLPRPVACQAAARPRCWYPPPSIAPAGRCAGTGNRAAVTRRAHRGHRLSTSTTSTAFSTTKRIRALHTTWQAAALAHPKVACYLDLVGLPARRGPIFRGGAFPVDTLGKVYFGFPQER